MAQPVVHFEFVGKDPERPREYFSNSSGGASAVLGSCVPSPRLAGHT